MYDECAYISDPYITSYALLYYTAAWPLLGYELHIIMYCKIKINNNTPRQSHYYIRRAN